jgi:hypothetical protein
VPFLAATAQVLTELKGHVKSLDDPGWLDESWIGAELKASSEQLRPVRGNLPPSVMEEMVEWFDANVMEVMEHISKMSLVEDDGVEALSQEENPETLKIRQRVSLPFRWGARSAQPSPCPARPISRRDRPSPQAPSQVPRGPRLAGRELNRAGAQGCVGGAAEGAGHGAATPEGRCVLCRPLLRPSAPPPAPAKAID